jgi:D-alanyl-D-alanine carboxypeptidase
MKRMILVLLIILTASFAVAQDESSSDSQCIGVTNAPEEVIAALDEVLLTFLDPSRNPDFAEISAAPGVVIRVESSDWIYYEAAGLANVETGELLNCELPFQIGSNTKMMTATVIMQLQEEGLLNIEDPLSDYLPEYAEALPFGDQITLKMLLNHTSGLFSYTDNAPDGTPGMMEGVVSDPVALSTGFTPDEMMQFVIDHGEPYFEPGAEGQFTYSNTNYTLLGIIIESLTGQDIGEVFEERIFTPLGMDDSFFWNDVVLDEFGLGQSYLSAPFDVNTSQWNASQGWAAGAVISTAEDMNIFITSLISGELFESDETVAIMQEESIFARGLASNYGLGIFQRLGFSSWGHGGQTLGYESIAVYDAENDISIVLWTNASDDLAVFGDVVVELALQEVGALPAPE